MPIDPDFGPYGRRQRLAEDAEDLRLIAKARAETEEVSWDDLKAELVTQHNEG